MIEVHVLSVSIPARSTVGVAEGYAVGECGQMFQVRFAGDHRPMRLLGEALRDAAEPLAIKVPEWAILSALPVEEARA